MLHEAVVEAELIVQDIQNTLTKQQNEIAVFAQQQKEVFLCLYIITYRITSFLFNTNEAKLKSQFLRS